MILKTDELTLEPEDFRLTINTLFYPDTPITLTKTETAVMKHLMENIGHVCSRDSLFSCIGISPMAKSRAVDMHISKIRKKMTCDHFTRNRFIKSVSGGGYMLLGWKES